MTPEERAEFEAGEMDAQRWRYFRGEQYRCPSASDPGLVIFSRRENRFVSAGEADIMLKEFYKEAFESQDRSGYVRDRGVPRPPELSDGAH